MAKSMVPTIKSIVRFRSLISLSMLLSFLPCSTFAVTGVVRVFFSNTPLAGALVSLKANGAQTTSREDGSFSLLPTAVAPAKKLTGSLSNTSFKCENFMVKAVIGTANAGSNLVIDVLNAQGRKVSHVERPGISAGPHTIRLFDNNVPAVNVQGLLLVRVRAGHEEKIFKMVSVNNATRTGDKSDGSPGPGPVLAKAVAGFDTLVVSKALFDTRLVLLESVKENVGDVMMLQSSKIAGTTDMGIKASSPTPSSINISWDVDATANQTFMVFKGILIKRIVRKYDPSGYGYFIVTPSFQNIANYLDNKVQQNVIYPYRVLGTSSKVPSPGISGDGLVWASTSSSNATTLQWDFEDGTLQGWKPLNGTAFDYQPTYGNNVSAERALAGSSELDSLNKIGGDYWKGPYPIGKQGRYWIGTYENRHSPTDTWGTTQGETPIGVLVSPTFTPNKQYLQFLIGGGNAINSERLELQVWNDANAWETVPETRRTGNTASDIMTRDTVNLFALAAKLKKADGSFRSARLAIIDSSDQKHINVDDISMADSIVTDDPAPVWGFADAHCHPMSHLAFGGKDCLGESGNAYAKLFGPRP
jgi:hypothetical protein